MIIEFQKTAEKSQRQVIRDFLTSKSFTVTEVKTQSSLYFVSIGGVDIDIRLIGTLAGVKDVHRVSDSYKLVSRKWKAKSTEVELGDDLSVEEGGFSLMLGPCSIENEEQVRAIAKFLSSQGVRILRGGAYKPRTSPYSFRGLGLEGLKMFHRVAREYNMKVISEVMEISQIAKMYDYVDIYQVGARNAQNFSLLHELGHVDKPVLLKRGIAGTIDELLQSAEYVFSSGNEKLMLCERGIRTFENAYRNTLDINAIPILKEKSHLPVILDPSHGTGLRRFVSPVGMAGVLAGADGLLVETQANPEKAFSDGQQTLDFNQAASLISKTRHLMELRSKWALEDVLNA